VGGRASRYRDHAILMPSLSDRSSFNFTFVLEDYYRGLFPRVCPDSCWASRPFFHDPFFLAHLPHRIVSSTDCPKKYPEEKDYTYRGSWRRMAFLLQVRTPPAFLPLSFPINLIDLMKRPKTASFRANRITCPKNTC
jgi:hypothetical protein